MMTSEQEFLGFMDANNFAYQRVEHPAVFTCAEADLYHAGVDAVSTKNLFLCDKKGRRFFLAVTSCEKSVKLDSLSLQLNSPHLRFGSEENLMRLLGVTRGSVTMMGLANDTEHQVSYGWMKKFGTAKIFFAILWSTRPHWFFQRMNLKDSLL